MNTTIDDTTTYCKRPKSQETRDAMRKAKLGVKKTSEHSANIAEAQRRRHALRAEIQQQHPNWTLTTVWAEVRRIMKEVKDE